jgi:hypothetical protein
MEIKNKKLIITFILSSLIIISIIISNNSLSKETIPSEFILGENMGFDLTSGKLNFGKIMPDYTASRKITIENEFNQAIKVSIKSTGEISSNLIVSENNFYLEPLESKEITFTAHTDRLIDFKKYKGSVIITSNKI